MINPETPNILRFYKTKQKQEFRIKGHDDTYIPALICARNILLPFQIERAIRPNPIITFELVCAEDETETFDLLSILPASYENDLLRWFAVGIQMEYLQYFACRSFTDNLPCGNWYVYIEDGVDEWFSELLDIRDFADEDFDNIYTINDNNDNYVANEDDDDLVIGLPSPGGSAVLTS